MQDLLAQRTLRLERTVRRQRLALLALAALVLGPALASATLPEEQDEGELTVQRLEVVDEQGNAVLVLAPTTEGGSLELHDANGRPMLVLGTTAGHGAAALFSNTGERTVTLGATPDGSGSVRVESRKGTPTFYMGQDMRGNGWIPANATAGARVW